MRDIKRVCVYCASSDDVPAVYKRAAADLGTLLARRGLDLVYGGGRIGLMGVMADAALAAGGRVFGVIPTKLQELELGHTGVTELFVVDGMHARKMMMAQLSHAFIAMPGGWGTLEELFEATTWTQLGFHDKPVGVLNVDGYYDPLFTWVDRAVAEGFIKPIHRNLVARSADPAALLDALASAHLPRLDEWLTTPEGVLR